MKKIVFAVFAMAVLQAGLLAQTVIKYQNVALSAGGYPFPTVRVCTEPASGTPCTPLAAHIYSDAAATQEMTNPFTGDASGNFGFFADPTRTYHVQVSGPGIQTYDLSYISIGGGTIDLTSPPPIGSVVPNTIQATNLTVTQGMSTTPPSLPYIVQGVDPTGTCPYPGGYVSTGTVQFCNLGPGYFFSEQLNDGGGNFGILTVRNPVGTPADGLVPAWDLTNQDFELGTPANFPSGIALPAYQVVNLPVVAFTNSFAEVTDAATSGSCTAGGGPYRALCRFNGAIWESMSTQITCSSPFDSAGCALNIVRFPGTGLTGQSLFANNGGQPGFSSPSILDGNSGNAVTTTPYTLLGDNATTLRDRGRLLRLRSGASVITVPDTANCTGCVGMYGRITDESAGTVTINASGSDRFNIVDGNSASLAQTTFTIGTGQFLTYYQDTPGVWVFVKSASAGPVVAAAVSISTANVTCGTGGTIDPCTAASTLTGLSYPFPNAVQTWTYTCDIIYSQATNNATNGIGVQTATNGASNLSMTGNLYTAVSTSSTTAIVAVGATTTPQTVNFTPTATVGTKMSVRLAGTIEGTSSSGTTFNVVGFTGLAADLLTFYRGSKCQFDKQ